jgi:hypothetical protein
MADLSESFAKLLGRQPSDAEQQQLYRVKDALGLENNDALWLLLMVLQHYQSKYEKLPALIDSSARTVLTNVKATADAAMKASSAQALAALSIAVAGTVEKVASDTSKKQKWRWAGACIVLTALCFTGFGWLIHSTAHDDGFSSGWGAGYSKAVDETAAAAWANTPEGKLAYRFARSGELQRVARCQGKGWSIEKNTCFPYAVANEGVYGWKMP